MAASQHVLTAARQWLRPLVHVLIRSGITWKEFADVARSSYVDVATRQFGKRGRPTNVSRTAVLTGLTRREVRRQRERLESTAENWSAHVSKAALVLSAWHQDPQFLDGEGRPRRLALSGDGTHSFAALLRSCGAGDLRPSTLLKELRAAGAVRATPDGELEVVQRSFVPQSMDAQLIALWGKRMTDLGHTYVHNLTHTARDPARFERAAVNDRIDARTVPEFRAFLEREGQGFLERLDAWLTAHQAQDPNQAATVRLGAGLYHIQD